MNKLIAVTLCSLFASSLALAQTKPAPSPAPSMPAAKAAAGNCEARAVGKNDKPLHGAAKAAFMKKCEREAGVAPAAAPAPAPSSAPAAAAAPAAEPKKQQDKMTACNKDAAGKKGDERKAFMKECLSK